MTIDDANGIYYADRINHSIEKVHYGDDNANDAIEDDDETINIRVAMMHDDDNDSGFGSGGDGNNTDNDDDANDDKNTKQPV